MNASEAHDKICTYLVKTLIRDDDLDLELDEPIFSSGLLDSFSVIQLMRYLEETFDVRIQVSDVTITDFDTVRKIETLVSKLRARKLS